MLVGYFNLKELKPKILFQNPSFLYAAGKKQKLLKLFRHWCDDVVTLISETPDHMILQRDIYDRDMIYSWGTRRVTLVGDAAHPMQPNLGLGGCMAIEVSSM